MLEHDDAFQHAFAVHRAGNIADAEKLYRGVVERLPAHYEAVNNIGVVYIQQGRHDEAIMQFQSSLDLNPGYPLPHSNLASALSPLNRPLDALAHCRRAHLGNPDNHAPLVNMSEAFIKLGRFAEAEAVALRALASNPEQPEALLNLGIALWGQDDTKAAAVLFDCVSGMAGNAGRTAARGSENAGILALARGDYARGWHAYGSRWAAKGMEPRYDVHTEWDGAAHPNGTLLVVAEQGLGDEILYLSMLRDACARYKGAVIWEMDVRLIPLVTPWALKCGAKIIARTLASPQLYPGVTHRIDIASLGNHLRTSVADFPCTTWLSLTEPDFFKDRPRRVGISWHSVNRNDGQDKSVPLEHWRGFLQTLHDRGVEVVSLQYGDTSVLDAFPTVTRPAFDCRYDVEALANLMGACDYVVTVSNTTAHLAGALGVPVTVLLADGLGRYWYWGEGAKTPWYPKTTIVRQQGREWRKLLDDEAVALGVELR